MAAATTKVGQEVLRHANKLHGMAAAAGNEAAAERLAAEAQRWSTSGTDAVVVAGNARLIIAMAQYPRAVPSPPANPKAATSLGLQSTIGQPSSRTATMLETETASRVCQKIS